MGISHTSDMAVADCFRGTFTILLVVVNSLLAICSLAVIGLASYGLAVQESTVTGSGFFLWVMLIAGIVMLITALMGCCSAQSNSKGWLCCYSFLLLIALAVSATYVAFAWTAVYSLEGATACNFNPDSTLGNDCSSYRGAMNLTSVGYLSQAQDCGLKCDGSETKPTDITCECSNGDSWFASVIDSTCPAYPVADQSSVINAGKAVIDFAGCLDMFHKSAQSMGDELDIDIDSTAATVAAGYFCACPARFTDAYEGVLRTTLIPGMIQGGLVLLLVLSACCLMCIPSQREVIVTRYYTQQARV